MILRVVELDAVEDMQGGGGGQPLQLEVPEPPQVEPLGDHRMQVAVDQFLGETAVATLPECHALRAAAYASRSGPHTGHRDIQPPQPAAKLAIAKQVGDLRARIGVAGSL